MCATEPKEFESFFAGSKAYLLCVRKRFGSGSMERWRVSNPLRAIYKR